MASSRRPKRPGPAHADRRELRLVREMLDDQGIAEAIASMIEEGGEDARARLVQLARRAGAARASWRGFRNGDLLIFREQSSPDPLALVVDGREGGVRLERASDVDAGGEIAVTDLDAALDGVASPVLAWLRSRGGAPRGASRLAALFEPRRRGTAWQSSQN